MLNIDCQLRGWRKSRPPGHSEIRAHTALVVRRNTMKNTALGLVAALALAAAPAMAQETTTPEVAAPAAPAAETNELAYAGIRWGNPFDPSTWWDGAEGANHMDATVEVDFADPDFWFGFFDAETHSKNHMAFTNPATFGQFMNPNTYMKMANLNTWMKWFDLASYEPLVDVQNYAYWMQPGAYMHVVEVEHYAQMLELDNYVDFFNSSVEGYLPVTN